jgi:hypothetical protein
MRVCVGVDDNSCCCCCTGTGSNCPAPTTDGLYLAPLTDGPISCRWPHTLGDMEERVAKGRGSRGANPDRFGALGAALAPHNALDARLHSLSRVLGALDAALFAYVEAAQLADIGGTDAHCGHVGG